MRTRNERRRARSLMLLAVSLLAMLAVCIALVTVSIATAPAEEPDEDTYIEEAKIDDDCTEEAQIVVGYDWDYVCRVVMAEAGGNSEALQMAVCQAIQNRCERTLLNPEEVCRMCYTSPAEEASEAVQKVCERVFMLGEVCEAVGKADMLYNPAIAGHSQDHECQHYVTTIDGVRFFEEAM